MQASVLVGSEGGVPYFESLRFRTTMPDAASINGSSPPSIRAALNVIHHSRLLEYNATLNAKDTVGCTPLHMAAR